MPLTSRKYTYMFLVIDATDDAVITLSCYADAVWSNHTFSGGTHGALLNALDTLLHTTSFKLNDVAAVAVRVGTGKFTATRIAVTVANTLAFARGIPVVAFRTFEPEALIQALTSAQSGIYVSAQYSAEARIGPPAGLKKV